LTRIDADWADFCELELRVMHIDFIDERLTVMNFVMKNLCFSFRFFI